MATRRRRALLSGLSIAWMGLWMIVALFVRGNGWVALCGVLYGLGMGWGFPVLLALVPDMVPRELRPKGVSVAFFAMDAGWILVPLVVGGMGTFFGPAGGMLPLGILGLVGGVLLIRAWLRVLPREGEKTCL
jgi:MFS family permease